MNFVMKQALGGKFQIAPFLQTLHSYTQTHTERKREKTRRRLVLPKRYTHVQYACIAVPIMFNRLINYLSLAFYIH